ncbi:MAG TPA: hypothetical protein VKD71_03900 [Gemmataceae bacterium]|nr:hypothetical protein [Gemmataceae bacterium]
MSDHLDQARRYHEAIRWVLLHEWDPIGVQNIPQAQDEYDSYVPAIHALLIRRESKYKLVEYLWSVETISMGLCGNRRRTEEVADILMRLPDEVS